MKTLDIIVGILLVIGGLNWGLVGLFDFNVVDTLFGEMSPVSRIVYVIVGLAALYDIVMIKAVCSRWDLHLKKAARA